MPRTARVKSESGIYHVMLRGINRQDLFEDDEDRQKFIETLQLSKEKSHYEIYAYCLMSNHVHLLLREKEELIALIIKRISSSYVYYYNWKYSRCGHLFQERFKSEAVDTDSYFLTALRYIHQNPIKAKMVKDLGEYQWSSYNEYVNQHIVVETDFALKMFSEDRGKAIETFIDFSAKENEDKCLDLEDNIKIDDMAARELIKQVANTKTINEIQRFEKAKRDEIIKQIKSIEGLSVRQIVRITGLSFYLVQKL